MSEGSLATPEVKKKITYLLGKRSSSVFICFARVLYASRDHTWIDDNLMGYFTVTITRGLVKGYPLYSALLFDYDSFDLKLCFEFSDNMESAIKCNNYCYIIPHQNLSFCLLFPDLEDALTFELGMNGVHDTMQRNSFPPPALESTEVKKKRRGLFSLFRKNKEESKDVSVSGVVEIHKEDGSCFSMLDRLSLQSDMARFHLFSGTDVDVFSDARLAECRVQAEPLGEADLPRSRSVGDGVSSDREGVVEAVASGNANAGVDTDAVAEVKVVASMNAEAKASMNAEANAIVDTMPSVTPLEEPKYEATMTDESVDLDEEEMMRLVDESVKEAVASPRLSPEPSAAPPETMSKPSLAEPVSQSVVPTNPAVPPAEMVAKEETSSTSAGVSLENAVSQSVNVASNPVATPKPSVASPAEESVSSSANTPVNPMPAAPSVNSLVATSEPLSFSVDESSLQPAEANSLEFSDLTASMINSIPPAPILNSPSVEPSVVSRSIMEGSINPSPVDSPSFNQPSIGQPVDQHPVNQPIDQLPVKQPIDQLPVKPIDYSPAKQPINQPPVNQPINQPPINQPPANKPINHSPINQPSIDLPSVDQSPITIPPVATRDTKANSRRRRRTLQPAIAAEANAASVRASVESVSETPQPTQPTHSPNHPSEPDSDISMEPSELLKAVDAIQPTPAEIPRPSALSRPSVLSSLSTDSVNEAVLEKAMEVAMETVDSAPHLLKPAGSPLVTPLRTSRQPPEIRRVSIGITPTPIQPIHRSGSTRGSEQPPIQPSPSTAIKRVSPRRVSLQPTPPPPRAVPPPPPPGIVRRPRPSLVRPSREAASSRTSSERGPQGRPSQPLDDPQKNNDDSVVFDIPTLSTQAN